MSTTPDGGSIEPISAAFARLERQNAEIQARLNTLREQVLTYARQLRLLPANRLQQWDDSLPEQIFGSVSGLLGHGRAYAAIAAFQSARDEEHMYAMASCHALIKEGDTQAAIDHARRALGLPV